jgi:hypothetical protein
MRKSIAIVNKQTYECDGFICFQSNANKKIRFWNAVYMYMCICLYVSLTNFINIRYLIIFKNLIILYLTEECRITSEMKLRHTAQCVSFRRDRHLMMAMYGRSIL